jgi:hypothetical protein
MRADQVPLMASWRPGLAARWLVVTTVVDNCQMQGSSLRLRVVAWCLYAAAITLAEGALSGATVKDTIARAFWRDLPGCMQAS